MWKLVVGFLAIAAFFGLIALAVYFFKQMKDEENSQKRSRAKLPRSWDGPEELIRELETIAGFFLHSKQISNSVHCYSDPMADIIDKIIKILIRFPERAERLDGLTEYILPLAKKFLGDLMFYRNLDMGTEMAQKGTTSCKEGLVYIQAMLERIADKMLDDINLNIEGELKAFLSLHEVYIDPMIDGHYGAGFTTEEEVQRIHQYVSDFREGKQTQSNVRPGINQVQRGGDNSVQIQIAGNYSGD